MKLPLKEMELSLFIKKAITTWTSAQETLTLLNSQQITTRSEIWLYRAI